MEGINKRFTSDEFADYVKQVTVGPGVWAIVMHHTYKPNQYQWLTYGGAAYMRNMQAYYIRLGWSGWPHVFAASDGIWVGNPLNKDGAGVSTRNVGTRHIEVVWDGTASAPTGTTRIYALNAAAILLKAANLGTEGLTYHSKLRPGTTECPGGKFIADWPNIVDEVRGYMEQTFPGDHAEEAVRQAFSVSRINPLLRAGVKAGLTQGGEAFTVEHDGILYHVMPLLDKDTNVYAAYAAEGQWDTVRTIKT